MTRLLLLLALCALPALQSGAAELTLFAGSGKMGDTGDGGPARDAQLSTPFGLARGPDGSIYFCEFTGHRVRRVAPDGTITTAAGNGLAGYSGDGGPASAGSFNEPHEVRFDAEGNYYVSDMKNHAIRRVDGHTGVITTIAGCGIKGYSGDGGPATAAQLNSPISLQFGPGGDLYLCDLGNHSVRKVDRKTGVLSTVAGTGKAGPSPDGAPVSGTPLNGPRSIDFDSAGHLWLCTREGNQVLELDLKANLIHVIAGTGKKGFTGNGGPARDATLSGPKGIALTPGGDILLADTENHAIRRIDGRTHRIDLFAGTGAPGDGPPGEALACQLTRPHGVFAAAGGSIYISSSDAHRIYVLKAP